MIFQEHLSDEGNRYCLTLPTFPGIKIRVQKWTLEEGAAPVQCQPCTGVVSHSEYFLRFKRRDHAGFVPQLNRVTVNHLLGEAFRFLIIVAHNRNAFGETAVGADEIGIIPAIGYAPVVECSRNKPALSAKVSACSARLRTASRSAPGGSDFASSRSRSAAQLSALQEALSVWNGIVSWGDPIAPHRAAPSFE